MAMIVLSSPATLTGVGKKKTGPSRFIADFQNDAASRILKLNCHHFLIRVAPAFRLACNADTKN
jgi:hypothetical protein